MKIQPPVVRKRKHAAVEGFEAAAKAWKEMRALKREDLLNPDKLVHIPYPGVRDPGGRPGRELDIIGVRDPGGRPGRELDIIGIEDLGELLDCWDHDVDPVDGGLILVGGKGVGKSCRLRVFACIQFVEFGRPVRILCIWNMMQAKYELLGCLRDALLFAYCEDGQDMWDCIQALSSLEAIQEFMNRRRAVQGETFWFILDGAQALDMHTWYRSLQMDADVRKEASLKLNGFLRGCKVLWGISPKAYLAEADEDKPMDAVGKASCDQGLSQRALTTYMRTSVLGTIVGRFKERQAAVKHYARNYPWFLTILNDCCRQVAVDKERKVLKAQGISKSKPAILEGLGKEQVADLLEDEDDWEAVLRSFEENRFVSSIEKDITKHLVVTQQYHRLCEMTSLDPRYALSDGKFCTPYVEQLYIDVFRQKEASFAKAHGGPWVDYCRVLMKDRVTNWAEIGWICERLCTDVVSRCGIQIASYLNLAKLQAQRFKSVRTNLCNEELLEDGQGIVFFPNTYNFGHIDGAIMYKDMAGQLHFVGLQFTTSLEKHLQSADNFMSLEVVQNWIPSAHDRVRDGHWRLHFAFICLTSKQEEPKGGSLCQLRSGSVYGVLPYTLHTRSFEDALLIGLPPTELKLLHDIAELREREYMAVPGCQAMPSPATISSAASGVQMSRTELNKLRKPLLQSMARAGGICPDQYRNMNDLKKAMIAAGLIVVR